MSIVGQTFFCWYFDAKRVMLYSACRLLMAVFRTEVAFLGQDTGQTMCYLSGKWGSFVRILFAMMRKNRLFASKYDENRVDNRIIFNPYLRII